MRKLFLRKMIIPAMHDDRTVRVSGRLGGLLDEGQDLTCRPRGPVIGPGCVLKMQNISLRAVLVVDELVALLPEELQPQNP